MRNYLSNKLKSYLFRLLSTNAAARDVFFALIARHYWLKLTLSNKTLVRMPLDTLLSMSEFIHKTPGCVVVRAQLEQGQLEVALMPYTIISADAEKIGERHDGQ